MNRYQDTISIETDNDEQARYNLQRKLAKTGEPMTNETDTALLDIAEAPFTWKTARAIENTEFVPKEYRGKPDKMLGAILLGRESGLGPMTSLNNIHMIDGKPAMDAELQVALVHQAGHDIWPEVQTDTECTVVGVRAGSTREGRYTFTITMAERAGLLRPNSSWTKYPESMLWARAATQLIRQQFPDVLISMHNYDPDELAPPEPSVEAVAVSPSPVAPSDPSTEPLIEWEPEDDA